MTQRIPLTIGHARTPSGLFALVDDEDYERVSKTTWRVFNSRGHLYAIHNKTFLHRWLTNAPEHFVVDHINRDGLDNRRSNLRVATISQNLANGISRHLYAGRPTQSVYKGVTIPSEGRERPYRATISVGGKQHFGYHPTEELAAKAYDEAAVRFFGQFARTNFPVEGA